MSSRDNFYSLLRGCSEGQGGGAEESVSSWLYRFPYCHSVLLLAATFRLGTEGHAHSRAQLRHLGARLPSGLPLYEVVERGRVLEEHGAGFLPSPASLQIGTNALEASVPPVETDGVAAGLLGERFAGEVEPQQPIVPDAGVGRVGAIQPESGVVLEASVPSVETDGVAAGLLGGRFAIEIEPLQPIVPDAVGRAVDAIQPESGVVLEDSVPLVEADGDAIELEGESFAMEIEPLQPIVLDAGGGTVDTLQSESAEAGEGEEDGAVVIDWENLVGEEGGSGEQELSLDGVLADSLAIEVPGLSPSIFPFVGSIEELSGTDFEFVTTVLNPLYKAASESTSTQREAIDAYLDNLDALLDQLRTLAQDENYSTDDAEDLSRGSSVLSPDIVSERLAQAHVQRGEYALAIAMYERLSMKNPEKSTYFAGIIEGLRSGENRPESL